MEDSCYLCGRTQTDLDRLNEEIRTRVYLSYFSNVHGQIDDERRKLNFLQRLKDEEGGDPHFRISARQVFGDPKAYEKLMPWADKLIEMARESQHSIEERTTIGDLVDQLLQERHNRAAELEQGLNQIRAGFATGGKFPFYLERVAESFPVEWAVSPSRVTWRPSQSGEREPLQQTAGESKSVVEAPIFLCSVCRKLVRAAPISGSR